MSLDRLSHSASIRAERESRHTQQNVAPTTKETTWQFDLASESELSKSSPIPAKKFDLKDQSVEDWVDQIVQELTDSLT